MAPSILFRFSIHLIESPSQNNPPENFILMMKKYIAVERVDKKL